MKALKGILTYTAIVLLSLVVIGALVIGIMFFTKMNVFGWYFLQADKRSNLVDSVDFLNPLNATTAPIIPVTNVNLIINTNSYGIEVYPIDKTKLAISTNNIYIGFLKGTETDEGYEANILPTVIFSRVEYDNNGNLLLELTLSEPEGLLSISEMSNISLAVPYSINNQVVKYNISAKTQNGNIMLSNSVDKNGEFYQPLVVSGLEMETNKGNVTIQGFGDATGKETKHLELNNLNIKTNGGTFDFTSFDSVTVNEKIQLNSGNATYQFNTLVCCDRTFKYSDNSTGSNGENGVEDVFETSGDGGIEINGKTIKFVAKNVYCGTDGFIYKSNTGVLKINNLFTGSIEEAVFEYTKTEDGETIRTGKLERKVTDAIPYENTIFTDSAVVELGSVIGKLGLFNGYGNVTINLLSNQATMRTENGDIIVSKSGYLLNEKDKEKNYTNTSSVILYSTYGNIYAMEYYQDAVIYSKKGKIEAHSKYNELDRGDRYFYSDISTKDGKINATTQKNPIKIVANDSANIKLTIDDVLNSTKNPFGEGVDMYQAISKNGTVEVTLPLKSYSVKVKANKLQGSIGATTSFGEDYVQINKLETNQPLIYIQGNKVILACSV